MKLRPISGVMLTLLLTSMLTLAFNIQLVEAEPGTIYIRADGSIDPPTANITSADNVTYTFTDNINDSIVVERDSIVVDGAGYTLQGSGGGKGIVLTERSNVTIKKTNIKGFYMGVYLYSSSSNNVSGNNITNNWEDGIYLWGSANNTISRNNITNNHLGVELSFSSSNNTISENNVTNNEYGVRPVWNSSFNTVSGNNITNNTYYGVLLTYSANNTLRNNSMVGNGYNFGVEAVELSHYIQDVDTSNTVDGKPIYYWVNHQNMEVPSNAGYVALVNSYNITVNGSELKNNGRNILANTTNSQLTNSNITNNDFIGVLLYSSSNNTISGNYITNNGFIGVELKYSSSYNTVSGNNIIDNGYGVYSYGSHANYNTVSGNSITNNTYGGVYLCGSSNIVSGNNITNSSGGVTLSGSFNTVSGNNLSNNVVGTSLWDSSNYNSISGNNITNNYCGVWLDLSSNNIVSGNNITNNTYYGFRLVSSSNNQIYHNNFICNTIQVNSTESNNTWDDGYPSGGNYWSDYNGTDLYRGPFQNETSSDGIGDTPYVLDENNQDNYPFMEPWAPAPPTVVATVNVVPNTLNFKSEGKWITAHVELPESYNASDIDVSTVLLDDIVPAEWSKTKGNVVMVKFDKQALTEYVRNVLGATNSEVTLTITGQFTDETAFEGSDTVKVMFGGDADLNGWVELDDYDMWLDNFGKKSNKCPPDVHPDFNNDGHVDMLDFLVWKENFGATVPPQP